jgi:hypothetical protein
MTTKFEQLIEYVINDEQAKARELFHDIVVEKSREIYEEMMQKDELEEAELGGDQADDLIDDIEAEETGISEDDDETMDMSMDVEDETDMDGDDHHGDVGGNEELEDRVMDLEDKLDELMAEFEELMGDQDVSDMDVDTEVSMDADGMDMEEIDDDEMETEGMMKMPMGEAITLKAAPKAVTSEEGSINKNSTVPKNSGARGAVAQPVKMTGDTAEGRPAPQAKDMISDFQNRAGASMKDQKAAPRPQMKPSNGGINNDSPLPRG